jgi:hypothetical protein
MKLNKFVEQNKNELNEGLKYFKNSQKLKNIISKIEYQVLVDISNQEQREELKEYVDKVKEATTAFEHVEKEYTGGNKRKARLLYKELKKKYAYILSKVDKPVLQIFKQYGSSLLYFTVIQLFSLLLVPKIGALFGKSASPALTSSAIPKVK